VRLLHDAAGHFNFKQFISAIGHISNDMLFKEIESIFDMLFGYFSNNACIMNFKDQHGRYEFAVWIFKSELFI
jgi:hypothetical protein